MLKIKKDYAEKYKKTKSITFLTFRKLGLDQVPRIGPLAVDPHNIGIVGLYNVHVSSADNDKASTVSRI